MSGWSWELICDDPGVHAEIEHDGRVRIALGSVDVDDMRVAVVDPADFEAMARSYLERRAEWRRRIDEVLS